MKMPKDSKSGEASRSTFFKKGGEAGFFGKSPMIQKKAETDLAGNYTGNYIFNPGVDGLDRSFFVKVKRAVADGVLDDADIAALRKDAIDRNGTVEHAEQLLMAAMRNPVNVSAMKAYTSGKLVIRMSDIRQVDEDYLTNFGRDPMPLDTNAYRGRIWDAVLGVSGENVMDIFNEYNTKAEEQIRKYAGTQFADQADKLIIDAQGKPELSRGNILQAMLKAAADSTPGDRIMAGTIYDIAEKAGHPMADKILSGALKIDALIPSVYDRIGGGGEASYTYSTDGDVRKSDTLFVKTDLDIFQLRSRALVIHELTHAADDFATSGRRSVDSLTLETHAYKEQGKYLMDQILSFGASGAPGYVKSAAEYAKESPLLYWSMVAGAKENTTKYGTVLVTINTAAPMSKSAADVRADLAEPEADLIAAVRRELLAYRGAGGRQLYPGGNTNVDGPAGHYFHP